MNQHLLIIFLFSKNSLFKVHKKNKTKNHAKHEVNHGWRKKSKIKFIIHLGESWSNKKENYARWRTKKVCLLPVTVKTLKKVLLHLNKRTLKYFKNRLLQTELKCWHFWINWLFSLSDLIPEHLCASLNEIELDRLVAVRAVHKCCFICLDSQHINNSLQAMHISCRFESLHEYIHVNWH